MVIIKDEKPIGVISERDIVQKVADEDRRASSIYIDVMSKKFKWVTPDTPIEDAVQKMLNNNIRRLIILDNDERLAGVITQTNLAEFLRSKLLINGMLDNIDSEKS